jgi:hypothetical protein
MKVEMIKASRTVTIMRRECRHEMQTAWSKFKDTSMVFGRCATIEGKPEAGKGAYHPLKVPPSSGHSVLHGEDLQVERNQQVFDDGLCIHACDLINDSLFHIVIIDKLIGRKRCR